MSLGRITIVSHSPYFPIGEYLTRCEMKRPPYDGFGTAKGLYLVRFAGAEFGMLALPPRGDGRWLVQRVLRKFSVTVRIWRHN